MTLGRRYKLAAVSLAVLAAVLLIADIGLGVHCKSTLLRMLLVGIID